MVENYVVTNPYTDKVGYIKGLREYIQETYDYKVRLGTLRNDLKELKKRWAQIKSDTVSKELIIRAYLELYEKGNESTKLKVLEQLTKLGAFVTEKIEVNNTIDPELKDALIKRVQKYADKNKEK